jgi:hypothetical protein
MILLLFEQARQKDLTHQQGEMGLEESNRQQEKIGRAAQEISDEVVVVEASFWLLWEVPAWSEL